MPQSKQQILARLAEADSEPRHRFGQNFMIDQNMVRTIALAANLTKEDLVIEIGPGTGTLTDELLLHAGRVVAVEIDRDLAEVLRNAYAGQPNFHLIEGDALANKHELNNELLAELRAFTLSNAKLVANLPYNIASPLVVELLLAGVSSLVFTVQKEVADRLVGKPDTSEYGPLTVIVQLLGKVEILRTISPQAFWPPPKIESALVRITREDQVGADARELSKFVGKLFSFRRKTLRKGLAMSDFDPSPLLEKTGLDGTLRPECFTPAELLSLYRATLPPKAATAL